MEVSRTQIGGFVDGVYFVPLAPLSSPNDIVMTIAENIGFVFHGENPPAQQLVNFLKDRAMLLVLDNFEHLLDGAELVSDIIQSTPNIKIIVTSRERLNLRGETVYSLGGLEFPTWETPEDAMEYDAVNLFMQSARRVRSKFELHSDDLDFLARICRLTAGMPLGIELAAGWVDVLSLEQIATEIQQGIDILVTVLRDMPERHRSLRATFEQTWNRLTDDEQTVFARLSVFRGGFTLQSAEVVAEANARHLRKLAQKSLIQAETDERFTIHELLRQFGAGKLAETDELATIQAHHVQYFADFMAERKQDLKTDKELEALHLMDLEFENVRAAWLYVVNHHEWEQLPKILFSLYRYCDARARDQEIIQLFEFAMQTLNSVKSSPTVQLALARVNVYISWFYKNRKDELQKSQDMLNNAIPVLQEHDSIEDLIVAYHGLANTGTVQTQTITNAQSMSDLSYEFSQTLGDRYWQGRCQVETATLVSMGGDNNLALDLLNQAKLILEDVGNQVQLSEVYRVKCIIMFQRGNYQQAKELLFRRRQLIASYRMPFADAVDLFTLGHIEMQQNNYLQAQQYLVQSLRLFWDAGYISFVLRPLYFIAILLYRFND
jgi:predicted ATPase